ncbi:hypothetical protein FQZ97_1088960 [compost metagenome]
MVLYPLLMPWLGLDPVQAGMFLGGTIHDVAQVVGAGYSMGHTTGDTATVVKLLRVAMLVPVLVLASWMTRVMPSGAPPATADPLRRPPLLPGFAVVFVALLAVNSLGILPRWAVSGGDTVSRMFLVGAMAAIGMKTHLKDVINVGWKPVLVMLLETAFLAALFYALMRCMVL